MELHNRLFSTCRRITEPSASVVYSSFPRSQEFEKLGNPSKITRKVWRKGLHGSVGREPARLFSALANQA